MEEYQAPKIRFAAKLETRREAKTDYFDQNLNDYIFGFPTRVG